LIYDKDLREIIEDDLKNLILNEVSEGIKIRRRRTNQI